MVTRSNILAWTIPWPEKPGGLQSMGSQSWTQLEHARMYLFDGCHPDHSNMPCVSPVLFQVHRRLLLHPFLCGRPAGRGPPLSQLQSSPGHLQAFVGLSQT